MRCYVFTLSLHHAVTGQKRKLWRCKRDLNGPAAYKKSLTYKKSLKGYQIIREQKLPKLNHRKFNHKNKKLKYPQLNSKFAKG